MDAEYLHTRGALEKKQKVLEERYKRADRHDPVLMRDIEDLKIDIANLDREYKHAKKAVRFVGEDEGVISGSIGTYHRGMYGAPARSSADRVITGTGSPAAAASTYHRGMYGAPEMERVVTDTGAKKERRKPTREEDSVVAEGFFRGTRGDERHMFVKRDW
jgi:hypothetical protein